MEGDSAVQSLPLPIPPPTAPSLQPRKLNWKLWLHLISSKVYQGRKEYNWIPIVGRFLSLATKVSAIYYLEFFG